MGQHVGKQQYGDYDQQAHHYRRQRIEQHLQYASHLFLLNRHENEPAAQIGPAGRRQHVGDPVAVAGRVGLDDRPGLAAEVSPVNDGLDRYREGRAGLFRNSHGHPAVNARGDFKRAAHSDILTYPGRRRILPLDAQKLGMHPASAKCLGTDATETQRR